MKQFVVICAVLVAAVFVSADESEIGFKLFAGYLKPLGIDTQRLTPEQEKCVLDGWKKVVEENENLKDWFKDIEGTSEGLIKSARECKKLPKPQQEKCFFKVWKTAITEWRRLFGNLTEEQKKALDDFNVIVHECVKKPNESIEIEEGGGEFEMFVKVVREMS